ncbi:MAG: hypothetical protein KFB93_06120 [Simkaniaceae bacterium]|nr:MAG: hypothetical protein KFB93_06120 [Simkaniaceae bacterium]
MQKVELQSWECPICFNQFEDPIIHNGCGHTLDRQCALDSIQRYGRCPSCNLDATMEQFKPNVAIREAVEELQKMVPILMQGEIKVAEPSAPKPSFSPSVTINESRSFLLALDSIKKKDRALHDTHVKKESTRKLRVDWGNGYIAVFKSGNWHFYKIGNGAGSELCKHKKFEQGVKVIFPELC